MPCATIKSVTAREIINGRGIPAIEAEVLTDSGFKGTAAAPSGVSVSSHEAVDLRDGGKRLMGKGVLKAVENIQKKIAPRLTGSDVTNQRRIDQIMQKLDGTPNKSNLGGNALTAVSLAVARAASAALGLELYHYLGGARASRLPMICANMLSGSQTAGNELDFEDYLIIPYGFKTVREAIEAAVEVFHSLHQLLKDRFGLIPQITALAPPLRSTEEALDMMMHAIGVAGYDGKIGVGIDAAAAQLFHRDEGIYRLKAGAFSTGDLIDYYKELARKYPIIFLEDGLEENDFEGFADLTRQLDCLVVGDDLFATSSDRLMEGARQGSANAVLLKINQAGTVSEALITADTAHTNHYSIVASCRSGETADTAVADLAVAVGAKLIKIGAPIRGEMVVKYNRLLKIEEELGEYADYRGEEVLSP
jgi:enolase